MKEQEAKELEKLVAKAMKKSALETPSFQFTDKVMAAVNAQQQTSTINYTPLIPKYIWFSIVALVVGITVYLWYTLQPAPLDFQMPSFNFIKEETFSQEFKAFTPSKITSYAVMLLALMLCVQIPMLKQYVNNRKA